MSVKLDGPSGPFRFLVQLAYVVELPPKFARECEGTAMQKKTGQAKQKCKNCEGKGTLKKGDKIVRCQRCGGTGIKQ